MYNQGKKEHEERNNAGNQCPFRAQNERPAKSEVPYFSAVFVDLKKRKRIDF
jgi:hypothetical protein